MNNKIIIIDSVLINYNISYTINKFISDKEACLYVQIHDMSSNNAYKIIFQEHLINWNEIVTKEIDSRSFAEGDIIRIPFYPKALVENYRITVQVFEKDAEIKLSIWIA